MDIHTLPSLLLAVLFAPLVFAAVTAFAGRLGTPVARRTALWLAIVHLLLTASMVMFASLLLTDRKDSDDASMADRFRPVAVPGDEAGLTRSHDTTWNLFTVSPNGLEAHPTAVQFYIGLDGLNIWLVLLASLLAVIAILVSWRSIHENAGAFYAWLFALQTALIGAFVSFDVILFYVFFELTLVPSFFLIGQWGVGGGKRDAARKFILYTIFGGLLTLTGLIGIVLTNPIPLFPGTDGASSQSTIMRFPVFKTSEPGRPVETIFPTAGPSTFSVNRLMKNVAMWGDVHQERVAHYTALAARTHDAAAATTDLSVKKIAEAQAAAAATRRDEAIADQHTRQLTQTWLFFLLVAGFAVKVPLVPFHTWLPAAYAEAPTAVVMIFSALMAKLGALGILRIVIPLAPDAAATYGMPVLGFLSALSIIYAAFCAYGQRDIKLLAAYSSVSHLGLLVLGTFALNKEGVTGATLHMVNHGLSAGALFALVGFLADRYRTTDSNSYGGLIARYPAYSFFMIFICLASVGLPGLNNFVSEMMLMAGLFTPWTTTRTGYGMAVAAAAGLFLSAWYTFTMIRKVFFGPLQLPPTAGVDEPRGINRQELVAYLIPSVLCLGLGLFPQLVIDTMKADIAVVVQQADRARTRIDRTLAAEERPQAPQQSVPASALNQPRVLQPQPTSIEPLPKDGQPLPKGQPPAMPPAK